jgi:aspartate/methionine/tyrosine aminotransferase
VESAARYLEDLEAEEVVLFDGLTKNWRYPGWRMTWTVGPKKVVEAIANAGSFLDGGGSRPLQRAAIHLLEDAAMEAETRATHAAFRAKRDLVVSRLERLGVRFDRPPEGTFYAWGNVSALPEGLNDGMGLFRALLKEKVIVVPGEFFDINPGKRRHGRGSRFRRHVRFSFGPGMETIMKALDRMEKVVLGAAGQA